MLTAYCSVFQQDDLVTVAGGEVEVVQHDDRAHVESAHQLQHLVLVADVEMVGGLVEEQMIRLLRERSSDEHPLLLPAHSPAKIRSARCRAPTSVSAAAAISWSAWSIAGTPSDAETVPRGLSGHRQGEFGGVLLDHHGDPFGDPPRGQRGQGASRLTRPARGQRARESVRRTRPCRRPLGPISPTTRPRSSLPRTVEHDGIAVGERDVLRGDHELAPNVVDPPRAPTTTVSVVVKLGDLHQEKCLLHMVQLMALGRATTVPDCVWVTVNVEQHQHVRVLLQDILQRDLEHPLVDVGVDVGEPCGFQLRVGHALLP